jgi:hypothetical protein
MDPDLFLVIGLIIGVLAVPSMLASYSEGRAPRTGVALVLIAVVLVVLAVQIKGGGYAISEIPDVLYSVIGRYMR